MSKVATYQYDDLGRLVGVTFPNGAQAAYSYDEMGNRTTVVEVPPVITSDPPTVSAMPKKHCSDSINNIMMVLLSTGELVGWGDNTSGALATGLANANSIVQGVTFDPNTTPPPSSATIVDWAMTNASLYVVYSNGWVYSAGDSSYGQLGHGDTAAQAQLKRIEYFVTNSKTITKVWAASSYIGTNGAGCCYFQADDKSMYGCGANAAGNLGNASTPTTNLNTPGPCAGVSTSPYVVEMAISCFYASFNAYMLMSDGTLLVAGVNGQGQLGTNSTSNVTGGFVNAKKTGNVNITNVAGVSATAAYPYGGSALVYDTAGDVWTAGHNDYGQLGHGDTTARSLFTKVSALSNITKAEIGGGYAAYAYAINSSGDFYGWGYNGNNNLFRNNSSAAYTPAVSSYTPGTVAKAFFPREQQLGGSSQLIVVTTGGKLAYAGADLGQIGIANTIAAGAYKYVPTPASILNGSEVITDVFVHGTSTSQRWFVLTDLGNLYSCGANANGVCVGGHYSASMTKTAFHKIRFAS
jgi:YD repeat-containing protein